MRDTNSRFEKHVNNINQVINQVIIETTPITVTLDNDSFVELDCFADCDGIINVTIDGGTPPRYDAQFVPSGYTVGTVNKITITARKEILVTTFVG